VPTGRWQSRFPHVAVDDAQLRLMLEEHTLPGIGSFEHRGGTYRQIRFNDERREMSCGGLWTNATSRDGFVERPIDR
jgi:hypothetical protein